MDSSSKIRIMHIVQSPGGVHKYLQLLLAHLDSRYYENILICAHDYPVKDYEAIINQIEQVKMYRTISCNDLCALLKIRRLIKKYTPDIIYCHSSKGGALGRLASIGIKGKAKIIYNPHGWSFNMKCSRVKRIFFTFVERYLARLTDRIVVISKAEKITALKRKICAENKIILIYNGIYITHFIN